MSKDKPSWRKDLEASALKQEHIQKCENAVPLVPEVPIMKGQLTYWYGFPGCGKTAAAMELAELASAAGYEVHYFQVDVSAADLKVYYHKADAAGFTLHSFLAEGVNLGTLQKTIRAMAMQGTPEELNNMFIILDTFKKFVPGGDVNHKKGNVHVFAYLRQITMKGGSVLILGHAIKYRDADGLPCFAGTQEIQDDSDSLVCLDHVKSLDGKQVRVNAIVKKARSMLDQDWGFIVHRGDVLADNYVEFGVPYDTDIEQASQRAGIRARRAELVKVICGVLKQHPGINQSKLIKCVRKYQKKNNLPVPGEKSIRFVLNKLDGDEWSAETDMAANNSKRYTLNEGLQPPAKVQTNQSDCTDQTGQTNNIYKGLMDSI